MKLSLTTKELAKRTGLSRGYIYHLEEGLTVPGFFAIGRLVKVLKIDRYLLITALEKSYKLKS